MCVFPSQREKLTRGTKKRERRQILKRAVEYEYTVKAKDGESSW